MADLDQFREQTSVWLEANCPPEMREPMRGEKDACWGGRKFEYQSPAQKQWLDAMAGRGWTVPDWPSAYGGGGLSAADFVRVSTVQRLTRAGLRRIAPAAVALARAEGLTAHAASIEIRGREARR